MGISRRALARTRGVSEAAIRKHIRAGTIVPEPDGTIDPAKADKALAAALTRPKAGKVPVVLATARQRRARAQARDLLDEVHVLQRTLIGANDVLKFAPEFFEPIRSAMSAWPAKIAPKVAGGSAAEVLRLMKIGINNCLTDIHAGLVADSEAQPAPARVDPDLDALRPVELAALIENLRAEVLELQRWERLGVPHADDVHDFLMEKLATAKQMFITVPARTHQLIPYADTTETERIIAREVDQAVAILKVDLEEVEGIGRNA